MLEFLYKCPLLNFLVAAFLAVLGINTCACCCSIEVLLGLKAFSAQHP